MNSQDVNFKNMAVGPLNSIVLPIKPDEDMEDEQMDPHALDNISYLRTVGKSRKMTDLQIRRKESNCTVGEYVLLDQEFSGADTAAASSSNMSSTCRKRFSNQSALYPSNHQKQLEPASASCCDRGDVVSTVTSEQANFSCYPYEVNFLIFSLLSHEQILSCRLVCKSWCTQIDFFFAFQCVLNSEKVYRYKLRLKKPLPFEVSHYDIAELTRHLKHKHFQRLPEPKSIRILKKISSKNFLKMMDCWRNIESLTILLEPLIHVGLFQKWSYYHPLEYFPNLTHLSLHLDRLHLARYKSFNPKQLRFNLDQILMNPYAKLESFSFQMLNTGRHFACAFLAPILMFVGRQHRSLREVDVVFHTGYELETLPAFSSEQHAPYYYIPLDDQIYVHGEVNLTLLPNVNLTHCSLAIPAVSGCTTQSGICNYFSKLLVCQKYLQVLKLETQVGIELGLVEKVIRSNRNLKEVELSLSLSTEDTMDMELFSSCHLLSALRLKRVGFIDLPSQVSQFVNMNKLPKSITKVSFERFYMSIVDMYLLMVDRPSLEYLNISYCYIQNAKRDETVSEETIYGILVHPNLKFMCFSPIRRHTLNKVIVKLKTSDSFCLLLQMNGWQWTVLSRELWLAKPRRLILHRGEQYCTKSWFAPYYFEKVKV
ncbi:unnamed protein product [Allacma fusca]|uniref:F-box domain-containing protein n=1 Tax=Allacma fusca TaxID=39272 RepID=A0A8J2KNC8_9HEXA|nr:unnamed protein product [Allacma fusca]